MSTLLSETYAGHSRGGTLRVASVPASHVYVRHLAPLGEGDVVRLPDPAPAGSASVGQWWPPVMLPPGWVAEHADDFDVFHLHFGFDAVGPRQLLGVLGALREAGKPFVYTVPDLRNPHHDDAGAHRAALDVLIPNADALITLTPGAAVEIAQRWGREARVIPHPHVLDLADIVPRARGRRGETFRVGIHAKSVRAGMRPLEVLRALVPLRAELSGLSIRFDVHHDVFDRDGRRHDPELAAYVRGQADAGVIDLSVHDYFTDQELWRYLRSLDLSVLPYAFGTHSGWLEACHDLGTTVLAPTCGYYTQQRPSVLPICRRRAGPGVTAGRGATRFHAATGVAGKPRSSQPRTVADRGIPSRDLLVGAGMNTRQTTQLRRRRAGPEVATEAGRDMESRPRLRIAVIASARYAVDQPFAGGLEAHTWLLAQGLRRRGHDVTLYAAGADPALGLHARVAGAFGLSAAARADVSMTSEMSMRDHHAYLGFMLELSRSSSFDVVHNNSIHHLPVAMARAIPVPMITTLHTPPTPWLESAIQVAECPVTFAAVSQHTARAWSHVVPAARVVHNGVDLHAWRPGPGGGPPIWFGRIVPEKGPHLAIAAARRARLPLDLIGPLFDETFYRQQIEPELGDGIRYLGHLDHAELSRRVAESCVSVITPCWDEPYGLVAAESLACGTPVAGFARGALPEIVDLASGILVDPDDVDALARAIVQASAYDRTAARQRAATTCSVETMLDGYEMIYQELTAGAAA